MSHLRGEIHLCRAQFLSRERQFIPISVVGWDVAEIWSCPSCEKVFLEENALRTHSSQVHHERLPQGGVESEETHPEKEYSEPPEVAKYSLKGQISSD